MEKHMKVSEKQTSILRISYVLESVLLAVLLATSTASASCLCTQDCGFFNGGCTQRNDHPDAVHEGNCRCDPTTNAPDCGSCKIPTSIDLISFTATRGADGSITLSWETGTEVNNAGFNLYRATDKDGPYTQINGVLVPAEDSAFSGASYSFVDTPGYGRFFYKLEDVDYYGQSILHGPVRVRVRHDSDNQ